MKEKEAFNIIGSERIRVTSIGSEGGKEKNIPRDKRGMERKTVVSPEQKEFHIFS